MTSLDPPRSFFAQFSELEIAAANLSLQIGAVERALGATTEPTLRTLREQTLTHLTTALATVQERQASLSFDFSARTDLDDLDPTLWGQRSRLHAVRMALEVMRRAPVAEERTQRILEFEREDDELVKEIIKSEARVLASLGKGLLANDRPADAGNTA